MPKKDWMIKDSELDDDQLLFMDAMLDKSCIVSGCAGSGKSVLALHKALQIQTQKGVDYRVIVFTKALCHYMNAGRVQLGLKKPFSYYEEWRWKKELKHYANGVVYPVYSRDTQGNKIPHMPSADYVIVDEIQDFTKDEVLEFIAAAKKNFFFFGDTAQSVYEGIKNTLSVSDIPEVLPPELKVATFNLYRNHRLPLPVARVVQHVGVDLGPFVEHSYKSPEKEMPYFLSYPTRTAQLEAIHQRILEKNLTDAAILLPDNKLVEEVYDFLREKGNYEVRYTDKKNFRNSEDNLDFSSENPKIMTYHSAKGLQFGDVFIPYVETFDGSREDKRKELYVAMTRTYRNLYLLYSGELTSLLAQIPSNLYRASLRKIVQDL